MLWVSEVNSNLPLHLSHISFLWNNCWSNLSKSIKIDLDEILSTDSTKDVSFNVYDNFLLDVEQQGSSYINKYMISSMSYIV